MLLIMRCVLAFSAFAIVCIDASEPQHWVELTRVSLAIYCAYSAFLAIAAARVGWPQPHRLQHWVDMVIYVYLVTLTGGTSSIFFSFFLFAILVAAFSRGFTEGLLVSAVSTLSFSVVGLVIAAESLDFELNRALLRVVYLFVFGYMISYWGGYERLLKRRLALLNEINNAWSPRFGVDHMIASNLDRLRSFYRAESCVLVLKRANAAPECVMYRSLAKQPAAQEVPITMTEKASDPLLRLPGTLAAYYHARRGVWRNRWRGYAAYDVASRTRLKDHYGDCEGLSNLLDASAYVTLPYWQRDGSSGRLYLVGGRRGFDQSDIDFLLQVSAAIATVVENMTLMEELISRASEQERLKISRDLHDSTIQPYIGLKLALDALLREAGQDNLLSTRLTELTHMAGMTIRDLRDYAARFKDRPSMPGDFLLDAMRNKAERLRRFYGIDVKIDAVLSELLDGRFAAEVFHIVSEGLSNILRHSAAKTAFVHLVCEGRLLTIDIGNEAPGGTPEFMPRSIHDRAEALHGVTLVERDAGGYTVVRISIPL